VYAYSPMLHIPQPSAILSSNHSAKTPQILLALRFHSHVDTRDFPFPFSFLSYGPVRAQNGTDWPVRNSGNDSFLCVFFFLPGPARAPLENKHNLGKSSYGHRTLKTRLPVRSALVKQCIARLVLWWVTTWESLVL
jgi:hypothetical protein